MPSVSQCPKCRLPVTIPDGVAPQTQVRCPLCAVVYPLNEAMAGLPPELVPVDTGKITPGAAGTQGTPNAKLVSEPFHLPDATTADAKQPERDGPALDVWNKVDADLPSIDTGEAPLDDTALTGFEVEESAPQHEPIGEQLPKPRRGRKKKKEKSGLRFITEVVGGGLLGLAMGYYLLCWLGGSRFDLPELPLPLLPHTMHWFADEQQPDTDAEESAANPQTEPKPSPDGYVGPRKLPSFTSRDLGEALEAARDTFSRLGVADPMTEEIYGKLCRTGRVITALEDNPDDSRLASSKQALMSVLHWIAKTPKRTNEVGRLAGRLLSNQDNENAAEGGILLAGTAGTVVSREGLYGTTVTLAAGSESVSVLSDRPLPLAADDQVVVLGSIINDPSENLVGFRGSKRQVVWAGMVVKVPPR